MTTLLRHLLLAWLILCLGGCVALRPFPMTDTSTVAQAIHVGDTIAIGTAKPSAITDDRHPAAGLYVLKVTTVNSRFLEGTVEAVGTGPLMGKHPRKHDLVRVPITGITTLDTRQYPELALAKGVVGVLLMIAIAGGFVLYVYLYGLAHPLMYGPKKP